MANEIYPWDWPREWEPPEWGQECHGIRLAAVLIEEPKLVDGFFSVFAPSQQRHYDIGEPVWVGFLTKNGSDTVFFYPGETPAYFSYDDQHIMHCVYIPHLEGPEDSAPLTRYGRNLQGDCGSFCLNELKPGKEMRCPCRLDVVYDMTRLGEYRFSFSQSIVRYEPSAHVVAVATSNVVALTVGGKIWTMRPWGET